MNIRESNVCACASWTPGPIQTPQHAPAPGPWFCSRAPRGRLSRQQQPPPPPPPGVSRRVAGWTWARTGSWRADSRGTPTTPTSRTLASRRPDHDARRPCTYPVTPGVYSTRYPARQQKESCFVVHSQENAVNVFGQSLWRPQSLRFDHFTEAQRHKQNLGRTANNLQLDESQTQLSVPQLWWHCSQWLTQWDLDFCFFWHFKFSHGPYPSCTESA